MFGRLFFLCFLQTTNNKTCKQKDPLGRVIVYLQNISRSYISRKGWFFQQRRWSLLWDWSVTTLQVIWLSTNKSRKSTFMRSLIFQICLTEHSARLYTRRARTETQTRRLRSYFIYIYIYTQASTHTHTHTHTHYIMAVFQRGWQVKNKWCWIQSTYEWHPKENIIFSRQ